ncbi:hypothetical protein SDC9_146916 [bioreactor metagenome]|uniref:Uncharacterized protein n=1 Tax=bioreactor metagenome TaxID=1076179 RepID=A0A645EGJ9_9ZZZZ
MNDTDFKQEREPNERNKPDNDFFYLFVRVGKLQHKRNHEHQNGTDLERQMKQHIECNGGA